MDADISWRINGHKYLVIFTNHVTNGSVSMWFKQPKALWSRSSFWLEKRQIDCHPRYVNVCQFYWQYWYIYSLRTTNKEQNKLKVVLDFTETINQTDKTTKITIVLSCLLCPRWRTTWTATCYCETLIFVNASRSQIVPCYLNNTVITTGSLSGLPRLPLCFWPNSSTINFVFWEITYSLTQIIMDTQVIHSMY